MDVIIKSYNCNSIRKKIDIIRNILKTTDILLLQEIMLYESDLNLLDEVDDNFCWAASPSLNISCDGRPKSGLAIFWNKNLSNHVQSRKFNDFSMGLKIDTSNKKYFILNLYLQCDLRNDISLHEYRKSLANVHDLIHNEDFDSIIIAGDLNADPHKGRFWQELLSFTQGLGLSIADLS